MLVCGSSKVFGSNYARPMWPRPVMTDTRHDQRRSGLKKAGGAERKLQSSDKHCKFSTAEIMGAQNFNLGCFPAQILHFWTSLLTRRFSVSPKCREGQFAPGTTPLGMRRDKTCIQ